jgi:E3 ubiquitin-protein ligase SHPRH
MVLHRHPLSSPRPLTIPRATRKSPHIDLRNLPEEYNIPALREWLDQEHRAFANAVSWSEESQLSVAEVATTLVVTPLPLLQQWVSEMNNHAPNLRICVYPGWKELVNQLQLKRQAAARAQQKREAESRKRKSKKWRNNTRRKYAKGRNNERVDVEMESSDESEDEDTTANDGTHSTLLALTQQAFLEYVRGHDVVITTYQALGEDLAVAHPAPTRSRRSTAKYNLEERPRSPLVMCEWWRVIMDEVQLHGDQTAASNMVSLIPRKLSLAMSGTPARSDIKDLMGSLRFLRVPIGDNTMWHRLMQPANASAFHGLFKAISVRTTKAEVAGEFNLPLQKRFVIPIQLSDIEMHYYLDTLERQRDRLRNQQGGFTPHLFSLALRHLRQICTHIQVGALQRGGLGNVLDRGGRMHLGSRLMTMEEALKKMNDDHQAEVVTETRLLMRYKIKKGQVFLLDDNDGMRQLRAIGQYQDVREMSTPLLETTRAQLAEVVGDREDSVDEEDTHKMSQHERERVKEIMSIRSR